MFSKMSCGSRALRPCCDPARAAGAHILQSRRDIRIRRPRRAVAACALLRAQGNSAVRLPCCVGCAPSACAPPPPRRRQRPTQRPARSCTRWFAGPAQSPRAVSASPQRWLSSRRSSAPPRPARAPSAPWLMPRRRRACPRGTSAGTRHAMVLPRWASAGRRHGSPHPRLAAASYMAGELPLWCPRRVRLATVAPAAQYTAPLGSAVQRLAVAGCRRCPRARRTRSSSAARPRFQRAAALASQTVPIATVQAGPPHQDLAPALLHWQGSLERLRCRKLETRFQRPGVAAVSAREKRCLLC